jgi:acetyl-CoA acetyltransferase
LTTSDQSHRDRCAIVGVGSTDFSSQSGRSVLTLVSQAAIAAISDAGLEIEDIDGLVRSDYDVVSHNDLANALGLTQLSYWGATGQGGGAPCGMVGQAVGAVLSGQARNVLVYRGLNGRSGVRFGQRKPTGEKVGGTGGMEEFFMPYGLTAPGQAWALCAQRHMHEFGTTRDQLGHIAVTCRERANANPAAQMFARRLTLDDHQNARMISSPLSLNDYCLESDGACAVVVTTAERAKDTRQAPVIIRAVAQGAPAGAQGGLYMPTLMRETITTQPSAGVARRLYDRAGMGPSDIDVAQLYDCFTITVLIQLEDYGFCKKGEGGPFAASGALKMDGVLPINTAGGNLSEAYIHGMNHVVEGVKQIRGQSTSQVANAETCLVTSGIPVATSAMILRAA